MRNLEYKTFGGMIKRITASVLVVLLLNFETAIADITPNTGNFNTNTNVSTDGNMTNITGGYINGDTGFHHFTQFDIAEGHIVNQIFGNANRFVNLVDNRVLINGIFNAIKNGQINGDVVFVSPMGIFVGETGIMNVGSLQTIAPTQQAYQTLINEGQAGSLVWSSDRFNGLELNRADDYEGTQISGKIFARNGITIRDGKQLTIDTRNEADIVSGFNDNGFAKTSGIAFADGDVINLSGVEFDRDEIINEHGVVDAQYMDKSQTGSINIYAQNVSPNRRAGGLIQSTGDINIRGVDLGGRFEIASKIDAEGNVNIGNEFGSGDSTSSSNAYVDNIIIHDDISSRKNVNIKSTLVVEQKEDSTITALNNSTGTPTGDIAIETRSTTLGGSLNAGNGISLVTDVKQGENSQITTQGGSGGGDIVIVGNADLQKIHNENGDISITGISSVVLNDTISSGSENSTISLAVSASNGSITQSGDFTGITTPGAVNVRLESGATFGSASQAIKTEVGKNISISGPDVGYAGDVYLHGVGTDLNLGEIVGTSAFTVTADKALNINADIDDISGNLTITAADGITQAEKTAISLFEDADKPGNISITNTTSGDVSLQGMTAEAGTITISNTADGGSVSLNSDVFSSGAVNVSSAGSIALTDGAIETDAGVSFTAGGSITQGANTGIDAGTSVSMTAGENITQESGAEIIAGTTTDLNATGTLNTQNIDSQGNITLSGESIAINELISTESGSITATATNGSITQTIADKALDAGTDITLSAANGDIGEADNALQLNSGGTVTMTGNNITVDSPGANVSFGTITANGDVKLSTTAPVPANMTVGNITGANSLNINSAGSLTMNNTADNLVQNNIDITAADGITQNTGSSLTSANGEINITNTTSGDASLQKITAQNGAVTIANSGGKVIVNNTISANPDYDLKVTAKGDISQTNSGINGFTGGNIYLESTEGAIGSKDNYITFERGEGKDLYATALNNENGSVFLRALDGDLELDGSKIKFSKDIGLASDYSVILTGDLTTPNGGIYIDSGEQFTLEHNLQANTVVDIKTSGGFTQGENANITAGEISIANAETGDIILNSLIANTGGITVANTATDTGNVNFNKAVTAAGDISVSAQNDVLQNNESAILTAGNNMTLTSITGNIGADGNAMRVDTNGKVNISANGSGDGKGNAWLTSADKNLTLGTASATNNLNITTTGTNASIITDGAIAAGNINLDSAKDVTIGNTVTSTGNTTITSVSDTTINGTVTSGGTTNIDANTVTVGNTGSIASTGKAEIISDTDVNINGTVTTDADAFISGKNITVGAAVTAATGAVLESVSDIVFNNLLNVTGGNATVTAGGNISQSADLAKAIQTSGTLALTAGDAIGSEATPFKIAAGDVVSAAATSGSVDIAGVEGDITFGLITAGTDIRLSSNTGKLTLADELKAQNGLISVTSAKDLALEKNITAKNDINITAAEGISHTDGTIASSSGSVYVTNTTSGDVTVKNISGSSINVTNSAAEADVTLTGTLNANTASGNVTVNSQRDIKQSGDSIAIVGQTATLNAVNGSIGAKPPTGGSIKVNVDTVNATAANGNINIDSPDHDLSLGTITAAGDIDIKTSGSSGDLTVNNEMTGNSIVLASADDLILNNKLTSNTSMNLSAVNNIVSPLMNTIFLIAGTDLSLSTNTGNIGSETGAIGFQAGGNVSASIAQDSENGGNIYLFTDGQDFNAGKIQGYKTVSLDSRSGSLVLNDAVSGADLILKAANNVTFNALVSATNSVSTTAAGVIKQNADLDKAIAAGGNIALTGTSVGETDNALDFSSGGKVDVTATTGAINVNSVDADVTFGTVSAATDIKLGSSVGTNGGKITLSNDLTANNGTITIDSAKDLELSKNITASGKVTLNSNGGINQSGGLVSSTGSDVEVGNTAGSVALNNVSGVNISVNSTAADGSVSVGGLNATENISVSSGQNTIITDVLNGQDITISAAGNITQNAADTFINAGGNVNLSSESGNIGSNSQAIMVNSPNAVNAAIAQNSESGGNIYLASEQDLFKTGNISGFKTVSVDGKTLETTGTISGGDVLLTALNTLTHAGTTTATGSVIATGVDITANGAISGSNVELTATNAFTNAGTISGTESVDISANSIAVNNTISGGDIELTSDTVFENTGEITAAGSVGVTAAGITAGGAIQGSDVTLSSSAAFENTAAITGTTSVDISGNSVEIGETVNGGNVSVTSGTNINTNAQISGNNITLTAVQKVNNTAAITGTGTVKADAADIDFDAAVTGKDITLIADNTITNSAAITGSGTVSAEAANITLDAGLTGNDVDLTATGTLTNNAGITGTNSVSATASNIQINELISGGKGGVSLDAVNDIKQSSSLDKSVSSTGAITLEGANIGESTNRLDISSPEAVNATATTGSVYLNGADESVTFGEITAAQNIDLSSNGDIVMNNDLTTDGGYIRVESGKGLSISNSMTASGDVTIIAQETINQTSGTITSTGGDVSVSNTTGNITLNAIGAELGTLNVTANGGNINMNGNTTAGTSILLDSKTGDVTIAALMQATAGNITVNAGNSILQDASTDVGLKTDGTITLTAGNSVGSQESKLDVQAGNRVDVTATTGSVNINSVNTDISFGTISAGTNIDISSTGADAGNISFTNDLNANGYINLDSSKNLDMSKNITATGDITLAANDGITQGGLINSTQDGDISITNKSTGNVTLQKVTANSGSITVNNNAEGGNVQLTDVLNAGGAGNISITAQSDITQTTSTDTLVAGGNVSLVSESGNIGTGTNNILISSGGAVSAAINTEAENGGNIYIASNSTPLTTGVIKGYQNVVLNSKGGDFTAGDSISGNIIDIDSTGSVILDGAINADSSVDIDSAASAAINADITAGTTVDINALNGGITQIADTVITGGNSVNITAEGGNISMLGAVNSTSGGVSIVNNTTGSGSMTVHDVSAAENINIENKADGLLSLTGTIDNAKDLAVTASNTGTNTGITTAGTINNRGNVTIDNSGQLGSNIGGKINNNLVNDADGESSSVTINNRGGALNIGAHVVNGTVRGSQNRVVFENWGPGGLHFLPDSVIDNHGILRFVNHAGDMTLYGTLINRFESDSEFTSDTAVEDPDADVVIGMKLENWGNVIDYTSNGQGSLIVDENASLSNFSVEVDGVVHTGIINLTNSGDSGEAGGGIIIDGTINNGMVSDGTLVDNDGNVLSEGEIAAGGVINIINEGTGVSGSGNTDDFGIRISETAKINNYAEMNIENKSGNGSITIAGSLGGDKGPILQGGTPAPVPGLNIKNNAASGGITFKNTASGDLKGMDLNLTNSGSGGITAEQGANVNNNANLNITNTGGTTTIAGTLSGGTTTVNAADTGINISGSLGAVNKLTVNTANSTAQITGSLEGSEVDLDANTVNLGAQSSITGTTSVDIDSAGAVSAAGAVNGGNVNISAGGLADITGSVEGGQIEISGNGVNVNNITGTTSVAIDSDAAANITGAIQGGSVDIDAAGLADIKGAISGTDISVDANGINIANTGSLTGTGTVDLNSLTAAIAAQGAISGANVYIDGQGVTLGNVTSQNALTINSYTEKTTLNGTIDTGNVVIDAVGVELAQGGSITADDALDINSNGALVDLKGDISGVDVTVDGTGINAANIIGTTSVALTSGADTTVKGNIQGGSVNIDSTGKTGVTGSISGTTVDLNGNGVSTGAITGTTSVNVTSKAETTVSGNIQGGSVNVDSTGNTSVSGTVSGTDITLKGDGLTLGGDVTGEKAVTLDTNGKDLSVSQKITGNSVSINAGALTVPGSVISETILGINTNGAAMTVSGTVSGVNTTLDINGLNVTGTGSLLGTTLLDINSSGALVKTEAGTNLIGGQIDIDSLGAQIGGSVSGTQITFNTNNQSTDITGSILGDDVTFNTNGLTLSQDGTISGTNSVDINSTGALVDISGEVSGGNIDIDGAGVNTGLINATGAVTVNAGNSAANLNNKVTGTDVTVTGTGVNTQEIDASGNVDINANAGAATTGGKIDAANVNIAATGVTAAEITATGTVSINAGTGSADLNGAVSGTDITIDASGVSTAGTITATGDIDINSANGLVDIGSAVSGANITVDGLGVNVKDTITSAGTVDINSENALVDIDAAISGADVSVDGKGIELGADISGNNSLLLDTHGELLDITHTVSGGNITINSNGLNIKNTVTGTGNVDINSGTGLVDIGSAISGAGISIDGLGVNVKDTVTGTGSVDINSENALVDVDAAITGENVAIDGLGLAIDAQIHATGTQDGSGILNLNAHGQNAGVNANLTGREVTLNANGVQLAQTAAIAGSSLVDINAGSAESVFNGTVSGGDVKISGNMDIYGNVDGTGTVNVSGLKNLGANITGGKVTVESDNLNMAENTKIASDSDTKITNTGALTMNNGTSVSGSSVNLSTGSLNTTETSSITAANGLTLSATGDISHYGTISGANVEVSGANIDVKENADITGTGTTRVSGSNSLNIDGVIKGSDVTATAGDGGITLAHNRSDGNIVADDDLAISTTGNITNGSVNGVSAIENSVALAAGGDITIEGAAVGVLDSTLSGIKQNGFVLDNTKNAIHISTNGNVEANVSGDLNIRNYGENFNITDLNAQNAIIYAVNGSITAEKVEANDLYLLANSQDADITINQLTAGGTVTGEANRNISLNSTSDLNIDSLYAKTGSIGIVSDGNTAINEIAAPEDISITVNDEKLSITNLGRVERDTDTIPKTVSLTVKDQNRGVSNPNSKLDILNAYVRNKVNLRADTITAQVYDNVTGQKRPNATGFHNANQNGEKLVFDVQGANYEQPETEGSLNPNYVYDPEDKRALDVNITIGDSVGDAVYGAHFNKLYADYSYIDAVNEADPRAYADLVFDSVITGEHAVFKNNKFRIETINTDTPHNFGQDIHYRGEAPEEILNTKVSYNLDMNDRFDVGPIPEPEPGPGPDPDPGPDPGPDPEPEPTPDPGPIDPDNPPPSNPEQGGGKVYNPHRHEHNIFNESGRMTTTVDKRNLAIAHGDELSGLQWTIKDTEGEVLGSSNTPSKQVILAVKNLSKEGMTVSLNETITKDREVLVDFKYDFVPFTASGVVEIANKNSAFIRFKNAQDPACEKMIDYIKAKKKTTAENL